MTASDVERIKRQTRVETVGEIVLAIADMVRGKARECHKEVTIDDVNCLLTRISNELSEGLRI